MPIFLSTLSLRRATLQFGYSWQSTSISIHALLAESDQNAAKGEDKPITFLSTLSLRRATLSMVAILISKVFLSTLSLRRATAVAQSPASQTGISIHALLAESDRGRSISTKLGGLFLSTLSLRRATFGREV